MHLLGHVLITFASKWIATAAGLLLAVLFAVTLPGAMVATATEKASDLHLASAGIIGTALALVLSLSQAAVSGIGRHLESGALIEILPDFRPEPLGVSLVVAHRHNLSRRVRAFMEWIEEVLTP